ncbi:MAG: leucyl/phenylalanyl-tRNA--protein transferase [Gammaproteobacteria bacterium]
MGYRVKGIRPDDPPEAFPDPADMGTALGHPEGLIAIGGNLSPERLIYGYQHGIFPWYNDDQPILWWSPDPRAVIRVASFHMSRSLARDIKNKNWSYSFNRCFGDVIEGCAANRGEYGTWITPEMASAYTRLHEMGYAHSVESWLDGELAGGIYGVGLGHVFFGESMFSKTTNGSKVAISALIYLSRQLGVELIDCQMSTPHLKSLGMEEIGRQSFLQELEHNEALRLDTKSLSDELRPAARLHKIRQS